MVDDSRTFLVLGDLIDETKAQPILQGLGFEDWKSAWTTFHRLEMWNPQGLSVIFPYLIATLSGAADPDRSLLNFERFLDGYGESL